MEKHGNHANIPESVLRATRPMPDGSVERPDLRGNSGVRPLPVERMAQPANDGGASIEETGDFDMSSFGGDEKSESESEAVAEPEELSSDYLDQYMVEIPDEPKKVSYPGDVLQEMAANNARKLNKNPTVSREVDEAFAKIVAPPGPPMVPPPKGATRSLPEIRVPEGKAYISKKGRELAGQEVTGVYNIDELNEQLRKMKEGVTPNKRSPEISADPVQIFDRAELDREMAKKGEGSSLEDEAEELDDAYLAENMVEIPEGKNPGEYLYPSDAELVENDEVAATVLRNKIAESK